MIDFTSTQILSLSDSNPEAIFSPSVDKIRAEYVALAKKWHPDVNSEKDAASVMAKIGVLHKAALDKIEKGEWKNAGVVKFTGTDNKNRTVRFRAENVFDFGTLYYGDAVAAFVYEEKFKANADAFLASRKKVTYQDDKIKEQHDPLLADVVSSFGCLDGKRVIVVAKQKEVYRLDDILSASGGRLDPRHVGWILNRLYALACFLATSRTSFNALNMNSVFIRPSTHQAFLLGGWEYATRFDETIKSLPKFNYDNGLREIRRTKTSSDSGHDLLSIKAIGRALLGDESGMSLMRKSDVPQEMAVFLMKSPKKSALEEYAEWQQNLLPSCFGKPKFIKMQLGDDEIFAP
jgi:hypothetical protein